MTEAPSFARTLDQPGNIGDHVFETVVEAHDTQMRLECRERVVGDLRLCGGHARDEGALAHVREPDDGHVGHELELESQPSLLAVLALFGKGRSTAPIRHETRVASATRARARREEPITVMDQVREHPAVVVEQNRALGHRDHQIIGAGTVLILALAVFAVGRSTMGMIPKREQRRDVVIGDQPDIAALRAVAAVGTAAGRVPHGETRWTPRHRRHRAH